jgi:hypothetical protein
MIQEKTAATLAQTIRYLIIPPSIGAFRPIFPLDNEYGVSEVHWINLPLPLLQTSSKRGFSNAFANIPL